MLRRPKSGNSDIRKYSINFRQGELRMRIEDPDILTFDPFLDDRDVFVGPIRILG